MRWLVNRGREHVDAMCEHGLTMRENGVDRNAPVHAATDGNEIVATSGVVGLIIVLVKSFHTLDAITAAVPIVGKDTVVLSLQDGLGHEDVQAPAISRFPRMRNRFTQ
jgi:2-dehydropantoate 2-reductase